MATPLQTECNHPGGSNLRRGNPTGEFAPDDMRRCQTIKKTGEQCRQWANGEFIPLGYSYCNWHGKSLFARIRKGQAGPKIWDVDRMKSKFYSKRLGPKLAAFVEESLAAPHNQQLALNEELALMREVAGNAISLYSAALELPDNTKDKNQMLMNAALIMQESLKEVRATCKVAAEVDSMSRDKFSLVHLQDIVNQISKMVYLCFDDVAPERVKAFDNMLTEQLRLPTSGIQGTTLTPDQDATEMDCSIPAN